MKAGQPHRVPLSAEAIKVLEEARSLSLTQTGFVFPGSRGGSLGENSLRRRWTWFGSVHGLRTTMTAWAGEVQQAPKELADRCLAHTEKGVAAAYFRSDLLERRRELMEAWADYLGQSAPKFKGLLAD